MGLDLGKSTNQGSALIKFAHQFLPDRILEDDYVGWFLDGSTSEFLQKNPFNIGGDPTDEVQRFLHIAYWYVVLREKQGDRVIEEAIASGCQQLLLLGSGYDTRFLRIPVIQQNAISTFEVDLPKTIDHKRRVLIEKLGHIPQGLTLIPLDFNQGNLQSLRQHGFDPAIATVYVWQGVSYYLPKESVSQVLEFIQSQMAPGSVLVFDCCSPLMTYTNDQIPGIAASIDQLAKIGEPYLFGMDGDEMKDWLEKQGFHNIEILQQDDIEEQILRQRTLPHNMWYVVVAHTK